MYENRLLQGARELLVLGERGLEPLEGVAHPALHRRLRNLHDLGDLREGQVRDLAQEKDLPLVVREQVDGPRNPVLELVSAGGPLRFLAVAGDLLAQRPAAFADPRKSAERCTTRTKVSWVTSSASCGLRRVRKVKLYNLPW